MVDAINADLLQRTSEQPCGGRNTGNAITGQERITSVR